MIQAPTRKAAPAPTGTTIVNESSDRDDSLSMIHHSLVMGTRASEARVNLTRQHDIDNVLQEERLRQLTLRRIEECGRRFAHTAQNGERSRPATMRDVIVDRGEYVGDGIPRTFGGHPFEPLSWEWLHRQNERMEAAL